MRRLLLWFFRGPATEHPTRFLVSLATSMDQKGHSQGHAGRFLGGGLVLPYIAPCACAGHNSVTGGPRDGAAQLSGSSWVASVG